MFELRDPVCGGGGRRNGLGHGLFEENLVFFTSADHTRATVETEDSGACSPPLWKNSASPTKSPSEPLLGGGRSWRTEAIVRGQWELMEMVRNMPESSYELTLRDLVECPRIESEIPETYKGEVKRQESRGIRREVKRQESRGICRDVNRTTGFENKGMFLKVAFPFSFRKRKKMGSGSDNCGKVPPKTEVLRSVCETDWWKKRFRGSTDSDISGGIGSSGSGSSSSSSSSSGGGSSVRSRKNDRKMNELNGCCWPRLSRSGNKNL